MGLLWVIGAVCAIAIVRSVVAPSLSESNTSINNNPPPPLPGRPGVWRQWHPNNPRNLPVANQPLYWQWFDIDAYGQAIPANDVPMRRS